MTNLQLTSLCLVMWRPLCTNVNTRRQEVTRNHPTPGLFQSMDATIHKFTQDHLSPYSHRMIRLSCNRLLAHFFSMAEEWTQPSSCHYIFSQESQDNKKETKKTAEAITQFLNYCATYPDAKNTSHASNMI